MGKRRIRCLKALDQTQVAGFDSREDRRAEAKEKYGVPTFATMEAALAEFKPSALIISVPPDAHHIFMKLAQEKGLHFFVEASVTDQDMEKVIAESKKQALVAAPSSTLMFHPAVQEIQRILKAGTLGKVSNILFHSGQYLPDWHTYEKVSDYYVSNPVTGGAREIVPFELTWMVELFGFPKRVSGNVRKTIEIDGAEEIDDTYNFLMDFGGMLASVTVDVVSRYATRRLVINGDKGQLVWSWDANCVKVFDPQKSEWTTLEYKMLGAEKGYNANIGENMYIDEIRCFLDAIEGKKKFINNLENDHRVLKLLYAVEKSDKSGTAVTL